MKKLITICLLLATTFKVYAQVNEIISYSRTSTIEDLKGFVGMKKAGIEKQMKKSGFTDPFIPEYIKEGSFNYRSFYDEEHEEMELMFKDNLVVGAAYTGFSLSEISRILDYFKYWDWIKTLDEKMRSRVGLERIDIWVSKDKKWKVKIDYILGVNDIKNKITQVTLTTYDIQYFFE